MAEFRVELSCLELGLGVGAAQDHSHNLVWQQKDRYNIYHTIQI